MGPNSGCSLHPRLMQKPVENPNGKEEGEGAISNGSATSIDFRHIFRNRCPILRIAIAEGTTKHCEHGPWNTVEVHEHFTHLPGAVRTDREHSYETPKQAIWMRLLTEFGPIHQNVSKQNKTAS